MKRLSWKYVAGLIDGEGCIDVQATRIQGKETAYVRPRVRIGMSDAALPVLEIFQNNFGGYLSKCALSAKNSAWQNATAWELCGYRLACPLLRNIVNHLILKKEQARFCLWMETNLKNRHVHNTVRDAVREELKLQKRDPHRLSERAQTRILALCDAIVETNQMISTGNLVR